MRSSACRRRAPGGTSLVDRLARLETELFHPFNNHDRASCRSGNKARLSLRVCFALGFASGCSIGLGALATLTETSIASFVVWQMKEAKAAATALSAQASAPAADIGASSYSLAIERRLWWKVPVTVGSSSLGNERVANREVHSRANIELGLNRSR